MAKDKPVTQGKIYDWRKLTKEFVKGPFMTVKEYVKWNEQRKKNFPNEERPSRDSILKASARFNWPKLKANKDEKIIENLVSGVIDKGTKDMIEELIKSRLTVNRSLLKILVHYANNPKEMQIKGDLSDIVNDLKRGLGMVSKEQQQALAGPNVVVNNAMVNEDSFRKQLEQMTGKELKELEGKTAEEIQQLEDSIPEDDLAFLEDDDE